MHKSAVLTLCMVAGLLIDCAWSVLCAAAISLGWRGRRTSRRQARASAAMLARAARSHVLMRRQGLADEAEAVGKGGCTPFFFLFFYILFHPGPFSFLGVQMWA